MADQTARRPTTSLLFVAIAVAFLLPPESLLFDPPWLRYAVAAAVAFAPVFLANLVFSYSFRDTNTADMAFASNLLGAMVGGMLEYLALITGYSFLLVIVAVLYALAWLFATRFRMGADRELTEGDEEVARHRTAGAARAGPVTHRRRLPRRFITAGQAVDGYVAAASRLGFVGQPRVTARAVDRGIDADAVSSCAGEVQHRG